MSPCWKNAESVPGRGASSTVVSILVSESRVIFAAFRALAFRPVRVDVAPRGPLPSADPVRLRSWANSQYGGVLAGLLLVLAVEAPLVHLLIGEMMNPGTAATVIQRVFLFASAYAAIWLIGDARLMKESAHEAGPSGLDVSLGLRWHGHIPYAAMASVEMTTSGGEGQGAAVVSIQPVTLDVPNVVLRLRRPVTIVGMFGIRREAMEVRLFVDEPSALVDHVQRHLASSRVVNDAGHGEESS